MADTGDGDAAGGDRDGVLVGVGDVEDHGVVLQRTVVLIGAHALGVVPVGVARTVMGQDVDGSGNDASVHRDGVLAGGQAGDVDADLTADVPDQVLDVFRAQRAVGRARPADAGDVAGLQAGDGGVGALEPGAGLDVAGDWGLMIVAARAGTVTVGVKAVTQGVHHLGVDSGGHGAALVLIIELANRALIVFVVALLGARGLHGGDLGHGVALGGDDRALLDLGTAVHVAALIGLLARLGAGGVVAAARHLDGEAVLGVLHGLLGAADTVAGGEVMGLGGAQLETTVDAVTAMGAVTVVHIVAAVVVVQLGTGHGFQRGRRCTLGVGKDLAAGAGPVGIMAGSPAGGVHRGHQGQGVGVGRGLGDKLHVEDLGIARALADGMGPGGHIQGEDVAACRILGAVNLRRTIGNAHYHDQLALARRGKADLARAGFQLQARGQTQAVIADSGAHARLVTGNGIEPVRVGIAVGGKVVDIVVIGDGGLSLAAAGTHAVHIGVDPGGGDGLGLGLGAGHAVHHHGAAVGPHARVLTGGLLGHLAVVPLVLVGAADGADAVFILVGRGGSLAAGGGVAAGAAHKGGLAGHGAGGLHGGLQLMAKVMAQGGDSLAAGDDLAAVITLDGRSLTRRRAGFGHGGHGGGIGVGAGGLRLHHAQLPQAHIVGRGGHSGQHVGPGGKLKAELLGGAHVSGDVGGGAGHRRQRAALHLINGKGGGLARGAGGAGGHGHIRGAVSHSELDAGHHGGAAQRIPGQVDKGDLVAGGAGRAALDLGLVTLEGEVALGHLGDLITNRSLRRAGEVAVLQDHARAAAGGGAGQVGLTGLSLAAQQAGADLHALFGLGGDLDHPVGAPVVGAHAGQGGGLGHIAAHADQGGLIAHQIALELIDHRVVGVLHGVVEVPLVVAALHPAGQLGDGDHRVLGGLHIVAVEVGGGIEVAVSRAVLGLDGDLLVPAGSHVGVKLGGVAGGIGSPLLGADDGVAVGLDHTGALAGEDGPSLAALAGDDHRLLTVAEVVVLHKGGGTHGNANAVLGVAVKVVVIAVDGTGADAGVAGVRVVIPGVVVGDIVAGGLALHALEVTLAVVPEVVVGVGNIGRGLGVQRAVALDLVGVGAGVAIEEVAVVDPAVVVALLQADVVALAGVTVHGGQVADLHVGGVLDAQAKAVEHRVVADALYGDAVLARVNEQIALVQVGGVGDIADDAHAQGGARLLIIVEHGVQIHRVLVGLGDIDHHGVGLQAAVLVVGAAGGAVHKAVARAVMGHDGDGVGGHGGALAAVGHHLKDVVARS